MPAPSLYQRVRDSEAATKLIGPSERVQQRDAVLVKQPDGSVKNLGYKPFGNAFDKYGLAFAHPDDLIPKVSSEQVAGVLPTGTPKAIPDVIAGAERGVATGAESLISPKWARERRCFGAEIPPLAGLSMLSAVFGTQMVKGAIQPRQGRVRRA